MASLIGMEAIATRDTASESGKAESGGIAMRFVFAGPLCLCGLMLAVGVGLSSAARVDVRGLYESYVETGAAVTTVGLAIFIFLNVAGMAVRLADNPVPTVAKAVRDRLPALILPALIFPLFLASYTAAKVTTPYIVGYHWDGTWSDLDRLIFRDDAWRIAHRLIGPKCERTLEWIYTAGWGFAFAFAMALAAIYLPRRRLAVFYTSMMGTWFIGGWLLAYCFPAAGPVFAHLFDPSLTERFAPLRIELRSALPRGGAVQLTQAYLERTILAHRAVDGGGISAMPSMHLGAVSIYVLLAARTRWIVPALLFWITIFVGSAYFGYHYWVDGIAAAGVAFVCWVLAERIYREAPSWEGADDEPVQPAVELA